MKPYLFTTFLFLLAFNVLKAQPTAPTKLPRLPVFNENTVVKDSAGNVYPYQVWSKLMRNGEAKLRSMDNGTDNPVFTLVLMSAAEKETMMAMMPKPIESDQFKTGTTFSNFKDKAIDGTKIDTKALLGKIIVLNFWFIGCPPCRAEIPDLYKITQQYKDNPDVIFVSVALDEGYEIKDFLKDKQLGYHVIDRGQYVASKYGVRLYPTNVVIDRSGKVAYSSQGGSSANPYWIQKTIAAVLAAPVNKIAAQ